MTNAQLRRWIILAAAALFALMLGAVFAHAHMHDRPDLNDFFAHLHDQSGGLCCDYTEGTTVDDPDWRTTEIDKCQPSRVYDAEKNPGFHVCVHLFGVWWKVPDRAIVKEPNRYGPAVVWPVWGGDGDNPHQTVWFRCFMLGAEG